ncbi:MAG TPA: serine/threonine-protein kinase [Gemmatimonadaceae bacterium]
MSPLKTCPQCGSEYELDVKFCPKDGTTLRVPTGGGLVGSVLADRYHILNKLGEGGMGQVYLAEHVKMGRKSAIKVMNPSMSQDPDAIGRFNREASNASRISHNNVCAIYDFGETREGLIYLAMEYVEGESLTKLMEREGALSPERAASITRQVADALDAAHDIGIVHRDLKPDNIMIARHRDGSDLVKVVDFGIAKAAHGDGQKVTKTGLVVGTPEYMSPEQLSGDQLDGRSDTYTLALVTFHMLTGVLPFPSTTIQESMIMRLTDRPRTLAEMRPDRSWPEALQAVLDRALQRRAEDRYQRASEYARELEQAVLGMPTGERGLATRVAGATVPPTAVRGAAATTGAGGATLPPTSAGTGAGAPVAAGASPAPARRRGVLVAVGAVAALAAIGVAGWMLHGQQRASGAGAPRQVALADGGNSQAGGMPAPAAGATAGDGAKASEGHSPSLAADSPAASPSTAAASDAARDPGARQVGESGSGTAGPGKTVSAPAPRDVQQYAREERPARSGRNTATEPVSAPPSSPSSTSTAPTRPVAQPSAQPAASSGSGGQAAPAADEFEGELTAERARAAVGVASNLLERQETERALRILARAIKRLPTLDDSITALYHVSEGLFQRAERTGSDAPKRRACTILSGLKTARGHRYAASIAYLFDQECK